MDQLRLSEISPKNMRTKAKTKAWLQVKMDKNRNKVDKASPRPQIRGSARGILGRNFTLRMLPKGTPMIPANIVITPNTNEMLKIEKNALEIQIFKNSAQRNVIVPYFL